MYSEEQGRQYIKRIQDGDEKASEEFFTIIKKQIENIIKKKNYKVCGYETEDLVQSCWVKCWQFVKTFDLSSNTRFLPVLYIVISNHVKDIIKTTYYEKRKIILYTKYVPRITYDLRSKKTTDYERFLIRDELEGYMAKVKARSSKKEFSSFSLKVQGYSYQEIADILFKGDGKKVDNALARLKYKLKKIEKIDFENFFVHTGKSGSLTVQKFTEGIDYEDFDPDCGSYQQVAKKILDL